MGETSKADSEWKIRDGVENRPGQGVVGLEPGAALDRGGDVERRMRGGGRWWFVRMRGCGVDCGQSLSVTVTVVTVVQTMGGSDWLRSVRCTRTHEQASG